MLVTIKIINQIWEFQKKKAKKLPKILTISSFSSSTCYYFLKNFLKRFPPFCFYIHYFLNVKRYHKPQGGLIL